MRKPSRRPGFTLLEVLLASLIAAMLLGALYVAMSMTLQQTQISREAVEVDDLARGIYNRVALDLSNTLGPLPPKSGGNSAASSPSGGGGTTTATPTDPAAAGTTPAAPATGGTTATDPAAGAAAPTDPAAAPTDGTTDPAATPQAADLSFQGGIIGTDKVLTVFVSRLPPALSETGGLTQDATGAQVPSDLWRVTYWLGTNGGLCRQERAWVTADGIRNSADPDRSDEEGDTLAHEVADLTFEYFDGSGWTTSWDGTIPGPDGVTPLGPPRAVRVRLTLEIPATRQGGATVQKQVVQVIPVRTAPGPYTAPLIDPSTDPGTVTPEDPNSSGTTGSTPTPTTPTTPSAPGGAMPSGAGGGGRPGTGAAPSGGARPGGTAPAAPAAGGRGPTGGAAPAAPAAPAAGGRGATGGRTGGGGR